MPSLATGSGHPVESRHAFIAALLTSTSRRIALLLMGAFFVISCGLPAQGESSGGRLTVSATLPAATVGTGYNAVVSVRGGSAPYQFAISGGMLPPGITLNAQTGTISGTPLTVGSYDFRVVVTDLPKADHGDHHFTIRVAASSGNGSGVSVAISPTSASVASAGTQQFTATVSGTSDTAVTWSASAGSISGAGLFTAPSVTSSQSATVTATSSADASAHASASVVVSPNVVVVTVSPTTAIVTSGGRRQFTATVSGTSNPGVTWSASTGTISNSGLFTAPTVSVPTTVTATATSLADSTKKDSATISVSAAGPPPPSSCGPPDFSCSTSSTGIATIPATPNMGGSTGVNTIGYAYSSPTDFYYPSSGLGNCITRLTDANSLGNNTLGVSPTGSNEDMVWSSDRSYAAVSGLNGRMYFLSLSYTAAGCAQVNNPMLNLGVAFGQGAFSFSPVTGNVAYHVPGTSSGSTGMKLYQTTLSGTQSSGPNQISYTDVVIFDYANCPGLPSPFNWTGNSALVVSADETKFSYAPSNAGGQGTANWVLVARNNGDGTWSCATWYTGNEATYGFTGNVWAYCTGNCSQGGTNPAPLGDNTTCAQPGFGIHANFMYRDGLYTGASGPCNGVKGSQNTWQIGTNNVQTCNGVGGNPNNHSCSGHLSKGYSHLFNDFNPPLIERSDSDTASFTKLLSFPHPLDFHTSYLWTSPASNPTADTSPVIGTDSTAADLATCGGGVTAPLFPYCFEIDAFRLDGTAVRFTPEFNTGTASQFQTAYAIGVASQDGYCVMWASDWQKTIGTDRAGLPRGDVFAICNLQ